VESFSLSEIAAAHAPYALSPIRGPQNAPSMSYFTRIFGIRFVPDLGTLTTYLGASADTPIVQRSWGLLGDAKVYGPNFRFSEYMRTRNIVTGIFLHFGLLLAGMLLILRPVRWLAKRVVLSPGEGPASENSKSNGVEYRAVGYPDVNYPDASRAYCRAVYKGGMYQFTALLLGQAALTILKDDVVAKKLGGGILTPATLGQPFIDRLHDAGFKIETKMLTPKS